MQSLPLPHSGARSIATGFVRGSAPAPLPSEAIIVSEFILCRLIVVYSPSPVFYFVPGATCNPLSIVSYGTSSIATAVVHGSVLLNARQLVNEMEGWLDKRWNKEVRADLSMENITMNRQ